MEEIKTGSFSSGFFDYLKHKRTRLYLGIALLSAAIVIGAVLIVEHNSKSQVGICTEQTNNKLMTQAASAISIDYISSLESITKKVSSLPNFTKDPNCLYVMFEGAVQTDDLKYAQSYLTDLEKIYPKQGLLLIFGNPTFQQLQGEYNKAKVAVNEAASNTIYVTSPK